MKAEDDQKQIVSLEVYEQQVSTRIPVAVCHIFRTAAAELQNSCWSYIFRSFFVFSSIFANGQTNVHLGKVSFIPVESSHCQACWPSLCLVTAAATSQGS